MFPLEFFQLCYKSIIWMDDSPSCLHSIISTLVRVTFMLYEIRDNKRHRSGNSCHTVDHDVCSLKTIVYEIGSLVEEPSNITRLMIIDWNVQEVGNVSS